MTIGYLNPNGLQKTAAIIDSISIHKWGYVQHYQKNCGILVDFQIDMNIELSASAYMAVKTQTIVVAIVDFLLKHPKHREFCKGLEMKSFTR